MKDLIVISAHCSNLEKRNALTKLVDSLQTIRKNYDLMIVSHLPISSDISEKVNYAFYDSENTKLTDWNYLNAPWFSTGDEYIITSVFFCTYGSKSNYLAIYRLISMAYSFAKSFGYKKVHYLEYDCYMETFDELYDNTTLLDEYDAVMYYKKNEIHCDLMPAGHFHSTRVDNINSLLTTYDSNKLLDLLLQCPFKTNEYITEKIYKMDDRKIHYKSHCVLEQKNSYFNKSSNLELIDDPIPWIAPYYNEETDSVFVIFYNNISSDYICKNLTVIVNDDKIYNINELKNMYWQTFELGNLNSINKIAIIVNDKLNKVIYINDSNRDSFKFVSYRSKNRMISI